MQICDIFSGFILLLALNRRHFTVVSICMIVHVTQYGSYYGSGLFKTILAVLTNKHPREKKSYKCPSGLSNLMPKNLTTWSEKTSRFPSETLLASIKHAGKQEVNTSNQRNRQVFKKLHYSQSHDSSTGTPNPKQKAWTVPAFFIPVLQSSIRIQLHPLSKPQQRPPCNQTQ